MDARLLMPPIVSSIIVSGTQTNDPLHCTSTMYTLSGLVWDYLVCVLFCDSFCTSCYCALGCIHLASRN